MRRNDTFPKVSVIRRRQQDISRRQWMMIPVADLDALEAVKRMIMIKKNQTGQSFSERNCNLFKMRSSLVYVFIIRVVP